MNPQIEKLYEIAKKPTRTIIGLMSGTSVDGLDIAVCNITNAGSNTKVELIAFDTIVYENSFKEKVASIFSRRNVDLEAVCLINEWIGVQHGQMINQFLAKIKIEKSTVDLIASHGQTIYHAPKWMHKHTEYGNATLQIGDGDHLAVTTGITTISDFRQKHIAAGGEGAPLAVYGDYLIFGKKGEDRVMLNIGGIANFTYLPESMNIQEVYSTDIGPGNTIMDAYCKQYFNCAYDKDAAIAKTGNLNEQLLASLLDNDFLQAVFPKTTGPELFNLDYIYTAQKNSNTENINNEDVLCTLNHFSATVIIDALQKSFPNNNNVKVYSSGGGMHNPLLMDTVKAVLPNFSFYTTDDLQINPDAKEAVLFAILANETVAGSNNFETNNSAIPNVSMGKISFPK